MNLGLSDTLKTAFPGITPVQRPNIDLPEKMDPNWLAGFTSGNPHPPGSFIVGINKSSTCNTGFFVQLVFQIGLHSREEQLLISLVKYLNCYIIDIYYLNDAVRFKVTKLSDINQKIIPFFWKNLIQGVKHLDFEDFVLVADLMKNKVHFPNTPFPLSSATEERGKRGIPEA